MKLKLLIKSFITLSVVIGSNYIIIQPSYADKAKFYCGYPKRDVPATMLRIANTSRTLPLIFWDTSYTKIEGLTPGLRCTQISDNFQKSYNKGTLKYLVQGKKNGKNVVCATNRRRGPCIDVLFSVIPGMNPNALNKEYLDNPIETLLKRTQPPRIMPRAGSGRPR